MGFGRGGHRPPRVLVCNGAGQDGPGPGSIIGGRFRGAGAGPALSGVGKGGGPVVYILTVICEVVAS